MMILAIDLAKARSLFCWHDVVKGMHQTRTIASTPKAFHDALIEQKVDRVVIEVCDMAGWIKDLCDVLAIPIQIANGNTEGWRWRNVKKKTDKDDVLKLVSLSLTDQLPTVNLPDRPVRQWKSLISKAGCDKLRKLLLEIAWGMLRYNAHGQSVFARISKGQKTRRKQAAVALARRILGWCWAMLRDGTDWRDPQAAQSPAAT
jgi:hypothetical protein